MKRDLSFLRWLATGLSCMAAFLLADLLTVGFAESQQVGITAWNPPVALLMLTAVLMRLPAAPWITGSMLVSVFFIWQVESPLALILTAEAAYGLVFAGLVALGLYRPAWRRGWDHWQLGRFLLTALLFPTLVVGATLAAAMAATEPAERTLVLEWAAHWWVGDFIGLVVFYPLLEIGLGAVRTGFPPVRRVSLRPLWTGAGLWLSSLAAIAALCQLIFAEGHTALMYLLFAALGPPIAWSGFRGAVVAVPAVNVAATIALERSGGPDGSLAGLQVFMIVLALTAYAVGVLIDALRQALRRVRLQRDRLDALVVARTQALSREIGERRAAEVALRRSNETLEDQVATRTRELERAKSLAEQANEAKSRFMMAVSHDLRTPLNAIIGFTEMMDRRIFGPIGQPKYAEYVGLILGSGRYLLSLIDGILTVSAGSQLAQRLERRETDLAALLEECVRSAGVAADRAGVALTMACPPGPLPAAVDGKQMRQVMLNLLTNAVKFSEPGRGEVGLRAGAAGDRIWIEVANNGPGIAADDLPHIFEAFWTRHKVPMTESSFGLGLTIAKEIVEAHGGRITATSVPGQLTTFRIDLTASGAAVQAEAA